MENKRKKSRLGTLTVTSAAKGALHPTFYGVLKFKSRFGTMKRNSAATRPCILRSMEHKRSKTRLGTMKRNFSRNMAFNLMFYGA
jgi:hypothetical protein